MNDHASWRVRLERAAAPLTALVVLGIGLAIIDHLPVGVFYDDAMYVILAKALATGHGYVWLNLPGAPPATHFPPGYPALLAVIWRAFPTFPANVFAFKVANAVLLALASWAMVVFARRRFGFSPLAAVAVSIAGCATIPALTLSTLVLSEPLFLALLVPILMYAERVVEGERRTRDLVWLGLLAGMATLVRAHGIALVAGSVLALLIRRPAISAASETRAESARSRLRDAGWVLACASAVMVPWQLWVYSHQNHLPEAARGLYESYTSWLARGLASEGPLLLWRSGIRTGLSTAGMFATMGAPIVASWARLVVLVTLGVLLIVGMRRAWLVTPATTLFFTVYLAIVELWPYLPARFLWGIWPIIILVFALGAREVMAWAPRRPSGMAVRVALLACSLFVAAGYLRGNARGYRQSWWSNIARTQAPKFRPIVRWVRSHSRPEDVIASTMEPAIYLYTGRLAVPASAFTVRDYFRQPTVAESESALRDILASYHVDAIAVIGEPLHSAAQSMASGHAPELVLRDSLDNGLVFAPVQPLAFRQPASQR